MNGVNFRVRFIKCSAAPVSAIMPIGLVIAGLVACVEKSLASFRALTHARSASFDEVHLKDSDSKIGSLME